MKRAAAQELRFGVGEGFKQWAGMTALGALSLQNGARVTDAGCAALAAITPLRVLNLKGCQRVTDAGLAALQPLERLTHLRLQASMTVHPEQSKPLSQCVVEGASKIPVATACVLHIQDPSGSPHSSP